MDFIRNCMLTAVTMLCICTNAKAQTVYYPALSSQLLKSTAVDMAALLQKAIPGSSFTAEAYFQTPTNGIVINYDNSIAGNQACKVQGDGINVLKFTAAEDNGLHFGIYQYLNNLGFRFYQPGSIWELTPSLTTAFKKMDTVYTTAYKYKTWFVSGGHSRWVMDNNAAYNWDAYFGDNGHNWALYQRRNGMLGAYTFKGHRGDIMSGTFLTALQNNPCYVANHNGSRQANAQSVPDIFNTAATTLWANTIEEKYTAYKNIIKNNPSLYVNQNRNFSYYNDNIGIEVADGGLWGNSKENDNCGAKEYPKESDQNFILANSTAQKLAANYPDKRLHIYAYSDHSDVPSSTITVNKNIDVQLIPEVYQLETSTNGIRNRWYNRHGAVSEYLYLNLSGWSGETPYFNWSDLKQTLQIAKDKKSQGLVWEAAPSKFASLPYLLAANNNLTNGASVENTLQEFCSNMFDGAAATVYQMMQLWGNIQSTPSKQNMQMYLQLLNTADVLTKNSSETVKERIRELKAYMHYMVLYFDVNGDDQLKTSKADKDAAVCIYLAKTNRLQLVNSYYIITTIAANYGTNSSFYERYNAVNGTAYLNGTLPLITAAEIENNFKEDVSKYSSGIQQFTFNTVAEVKEQIKTQGLAPLGKINVQLQYTNGFNYYNRAVFNIIAPAAGKFIINYTPRFDMPGKGYMNFLVESADKTLQVITDVNIDNNSGSGTITVNLPAAGNYVLTVSSKYKTAAALSITTNGNYFYKNGAFLGSKTELYRNDVTSLPGYFYVPAGVSKVYFTVNNSFSDNKFASASMVSNTFNLKDDKGNSVQPKFVTAKDSTLFYLEVPSASAGTFLQATNMAQYNLQFVNISNLLWYAQRTDAKKNDTEENNTPLNTPAVKPAPVMYPNPSAGVFNCMVNGAVVKADDITVFTLSGIKIAAFKNASQFSIVNAAPGLYVYQLTFNGAVYKGKIIKQ
jgi:hypothetical protein